MFQVFQRVHDGNGEGSIGDVHIAVAEVDLHELRELRRLATDERDVGE